MSNLPFHVQFVLRNSTSRRWSTFHLLQFQCPIAGFQQGLVWNSSREAIWYRSQDSQPQSSDYFPQFQQCMLIDWWALRVPVFGIFWTKDIYCYECCIANEFAYRKLKFSNSMFTANIWVSFPRCSIRSAASIACSLCSWCSGPQCWWYFHADQQLIS